MIFRRKKISAEQEIKLLEAEIQKLESETELKTAQSLASHFKQIREANHFAEQFAKALGGRNG